LCGAPKASAPCPCSGSYFIPYGYINGCSTPTAFWASAFLVSTLPWLVLQPLAIGLQYCQLLFAQALAVGATIATNSIRCGLSEAACPATGERFQDAAQLLMLLIDPFLPGTGASLRPRRACYAVLALGQVTAGYFMVLALTLRFEVRRRMQFVSEKGLWGLYRQLERTWDRQWQPLLGTYLALALTWHVLVMVLGQSGAGAETSRRA
jgi:hypothetical protein